MIACVFHEGSGLGNQLHRYVFVRTLAKDRGWDFGVQSPERFKGASFMNLDMGLEPHNLRENFLEARVENGRGVDVRTYDPKIFEIKDGTRIDGEFQGEEYFEHRIDEIREWLAVEPLDMPDNLCVIGFRGGEYVGVQDLFLPKEYWDKAIARMKENHPNMKFEVHTDDPDTARSFFPDYPILHDIALNWRSVRYAKYLIIANSSFYILPTLLNQDKKHVIAPKFWARRNLGFWALPYNEYKEWDYM